MKNSISIFSGLVVLLGALSGCSAGSDATSGQSEGAVAAAATPVNIEQLAAPAIAKVFQMDKTQRVYIPTAVTLPAYIPVSPLYAISQIYPQFGANSTPLPGPKNYSITLSDYPDCNGANACTFANFYSLGAAETGFNPNVTVDGHPADYEPEHCGKSCTRPSIAWKEADTIFAIDVMGATKDDLTKLMHSVLDAGSYEAQVSVDQLVKPAIADVLHQDHSQRVFAPTTVPASITTERLYAFDEVIPQYNNDGTPAAGPKDYQISLGTTADCKGAEACTVATFFSLARTADFHPNVTVDGHPAEYQPGSCGASCAPPSISWMDGTRLVGIDAKTVPSKNNMIGMMHSALAAGAYASP